MIIPNRGLPSDAGWSSIISDLEFLITETLVRRNLTLCKSESLIKSILLVKPVTLSLLFNPVNEDGTAPVAIFSAIKLDAQHCNNTYQDQFLKILLQQHRS